MNKKRVVITGLGVLSPIGIGKQEFTDALREGKSGANANTAFDTSNYTTKFCANVKDFVPENFIDRKKQEEWPDLPKWVLLPPKWQ